MTPVAQKPILRVDVAAVSGTIALTDRVRTRREQYLKAMPYVCAERAHLATLSWQETEGKPVVIRRARLMEKVLGSIPIAIHEGELIVGSQTRYVRGASPSIDFSSEYGNAVSGQKVTTRGEAVKAVVSDGDRKLILADAEWWKGRSPADIIAEVTGEVFGSALAAIVETRLADRFAEGNVYPRSADFEKILRLGLRGIIEECQNELASLTLGTQDEVEKYYFLQAAIISLGAVINYAKRHATLARDLAASESNPSRRKELEKIAEVCERVPEHPARDFREALQSFRLVILCLNLETAYANEIPGRMDQYLYPFYANDIIAGNLTRQEAAELLGCLWIKFAEMDCVKAGSAWLLAATQGNHGLQVTIGGVDQAGRDATNELSYLILHVTGQIKLPQPAVFVRWHDSIPHELMVKAIEANRAVGGGIPAFLNDKQQIPLLLSEGVSLADARDYAGFGCVHPYIPHSSGQYKVTVISCAKVLEITLNDGADPRTGKQVGPRTGDPRTFSTFDELYQAFEKQFAFFADFQTRYGNMAWHVRETCYAMPLHSALVNDCIKKGKDVLRGGSRYPQHAFALFNRGMQNAADSLTAMKKLVFEDRKVSMDELLSALASNFEGKEELRQMLVDAPKYGNNDDYADEVMRRVSIGTMELIHSLPNPYGYHRRDCRNGAALHYHQGQAIGALPDGRKAGEPLADAALSPMRGVDRNGPTAVVNSAAKVTDFSRLVSGNLNQRFSGAMVQTREQIDKVISLIETYFASFLGQHIQFNILSRELLLEAKKHPEQYRDLVVRIGGYSAFWVELTPQMQDEIISRTEQTF